MNVTEAGFQGGPFHAAMLADVQDQPEGFACGIQKGIYVVQVQTFPLHQTPLHKIE